VAYAWIVPHIRSRPLPPTAVPVQYLLTMLSRYAQAQWHLPCALPQPTPRLAYCVASLACRSRFCGPTPSRPPTRATQRGPPYCVTTAAEEWTELAQDRASRVETSGSATGESVCAFCMSTCLKCRLAEQISTKFDTKVPAPRSSYLFHFQQ
jgi:hypothetical protein